MKDNVLKKLNQLKNFQNSYFYWENQTIFHILCIVKFVSEVFMNFPIELIHLINIFYLYCNSQLMQNNIISGSNYSILLIQQNIYGCGNNRYGQLGFIGNHENIEKENNFQKIIRVQNVISLSCGFDHTLFLTKEGLFGCGSNGQGQLGLEGELRDPVEGININNVISFTCGKYYSFVLTREGLFCSGDNRFGQLGLDSDNLFQKSFIKIDISNVILFSCGGYHTIVLTKEGLFGCGLNYYGQLGSGDDQLGRGRKFQKITIQNDVLYKTKSNKIYSKKNNISNIISIACGEFHSFVLSSEGLFSCGGNTEGQLGLGDKLSKNSFQKVKSRNVISIVCGGYHSMALTKRGGLYSCGLNCYGQLGLGNNSSQYLFQKINILNVISFSCGENHSMIMTSEGLFSCGNNNYGQLGLGDNINQNNFIKNNIDFKTYE